MSAPFTEGPWHYETDERGNVVVYATRNGDDDKIIIGMSHFGPLEQREADARLIATAPGLYETLEDIQAEIAADHLGVLEAIESIVAVALAEARGEQVV